MRYNGCKIWWHEQARYLYYYEHIWDMPTHFIIDDYETWHLPATYLASAYHSLPSLFVSYLFLSITRQMSSLFPSLKRWLFMRLFLFTVFCLIFTFSVVYLSPEYLHSDDEEHDRYDDQEYPRKKRSEATYSLAQFVFSPYWIQANTWHTQLRIQTRPVFRQ